MIMVTGERLSRCPAEWIAQQITDVFPWDEAPTGLIRDRDARYGQAVRRRLSAMGIWDHPIARRSATSGWPDSRCLSIASSECPVVSGTRARVKRMPLRQITANIVKVKARPGPASMTGKANTTTKLKPQLLIEAMLMPGPRTRSGKISDIIT